MNITSSALAMLSYCKLKDLGNFVIFFVIILFAHSSLFAQSFYQVYEQGEGFHGNIVVLKENGYEIQVPVQFNFQLPTFNIDPDGNFISSVQNDYDNLGLKRLSDGTHVKTVKVNESLSWTLNDNVTSALIYSIAGPAGEIIDFGGIHEFPDGDLHLAYYFGQEGVPGNIEQRTVKHLKINKYTGTIAWQKEFMSTEERPIAIFNLMEVAEDGSFFTSREEELFGSSNYYISKYSSNGDRLWDQYISGISKFPTHLAPTTDGGVCYLINQVLESVYKIDADGNTIPEQLLDNIFSDDVAPTAIIPGPDKTVFVAGVFVSGNDTPLFTALLDEDLQLIDTAIHNQFDMMPIAYHGIRISTGEYVLTGKARPASGFSMPFLLKLNPSGQFLTAAETDLDEDGYFADVDCDDNNAAINPDATEITYNGIDEDCNSLTLDDDLDEDGFNLDQDCDDNNAEINPDATEITYNGIDEDCNSLTLDDDLDEDGFNLDQDCDDNNAEINPDATEITYNGIDEDCNSLTLDDDLDEDGFNIDQDCDDNNAAINPDATEIADNGIDEDCDGEDLITNSASSIVKNNFHFYPNPATDNIFIESIIKEYTLELIDISGRVLMREFNAKQLAVDELSAGLYLVKLIGEEEMVCRFVVIKQ